MQRFERVRVHFQKVKAFYNRFERWLMPVTLAAGFVADYITFVNIQINTALLLLVIYWLVAALAISFVHLYDAGKLPEKFRYVRLFIPLLIQFTFGGLLSNSFIFYWFSGSLATSWPFILIFVLLMVSNDALRHYLLRPIVQISLYFFATLSLFSVALPFLLNSLDPKLFVYASILSALVIFFFVALLSTFRSEVKTERYYIFYSICGILLVMNVLYFKNFIPPIPLSIREAGVYHSVQRSGGKYILKGEKETFWQKITPGHQINLNSKERVYVYTAIYAPKELNTAIFHHWQYYDEAKGVWVEKDRLGFTLTGGRKEGFRGYSYKSVLLPGKWRVFVKTARGQTLGLVKFTIKNSQAPTELLEFIR